MTPERVFGYDTLVIAIGSLSNDFGTPGVREHALRLESKADAQRFHARMVNACIRAHAQTDAAAARAAARRDHRRGRHRRRARGRAAPHHARGRGLRAGPRRCRQGHPGQRHRGRRPRAAGAAAAACRRPPRRCCASSACDVYTSAKVAEVLPDGVRLADGRIAAGRTGGLGGGREGARLPEGHRRTRNQPQQPARRAPDPADDARRRRLRDRRLRGLRLARGQRRQGRLRAAARAGGAPAGLARCRRRSGAAWPASR